jgi:hypothetical protein
MATYGKTSPYANTKVSPAGELDILSIRPIPAEDDDVLYTIMPHYSNRPDLLAHDLYGSKNLWWVFTQRNMEILKDPVFDFVAGTEIFLPKKSKLNPGLGI